MRKVNGKSINQWNVERYLCRGNERVSSSEDECCTKRLQTDIKRVQVNRKTCSLLSFLLCVIRSTHRQQIGQHCTPLERALATITNATSAVLDLVERCCAVSRQTLLLRKGGFTYTTHSFGTTLLSRICYSLGLNGLFER